MEPFMQAQQGSEHVQGFSFESISDRREAYDVRGLFWLRGSAREDIALRHITSVDLATSQYSFLGVALVILALIQLNVGLDVVAVITPLVLGITLLWGSSKVRLNTGGSDHRFVHGSP